MSPPVAVRVMVGVEQEIRVTGAVMPAVTGVVLPPITTLADPVQPLPVVVVSE